MSTIKTNLLLIDSIIKDTNVLLSSLNNETFGIIYNYDTSRNTILQQIEANFSNNISRIAIITHEGVTTFLENTSFFDVSYNQILNSNFDSNSEEMTESEYHTTFGGIIKNANSQFILDLLERYNVSNIDYLACNSLKYDSWKHYYDFIESQSEGVIVGASDDKTGNIKYGGNWVMENTGEQIDNIYFNEGLEYYKYLFTFYNWNIIFKQKYPKTYSTSDYLSFGSESSDNYSILGSYDTTFGMQYSTNFIYKIEWDNGKYLIFEQNKEFSRNTSDLTGFTYSVLENGTGGTLSTNTGLAFQGLTSAGAPTSYTFFDGSHSTGYFWYSVAMKLYYHGGTIPAYYNASGYLSSSVNIYVHVPPSLDPFTITPSTITLETTSPTIDMTFNFAITSSEISSSLSINPSGAGTIDTGSITNTSGTNWTAIFTPASNVDFSNCSITFSNSTYSLNTTANFSVNTIPTDPLVTNISINPNPITFDISSAQVSITFDKDVPETESEFLPMISVISASSEILSGIEIQISNLTKTNNGQNWEFTMSVLNYGINKTQNKVKIDYNISPTYEELFDINTIIPDISSMTLSNDLVVPDTSAVLTIVFNSDYFSGQSIMSNFIFIPPYDIEFNSMGNVSGNTWRGKLSVISINEPYIYRENNIISYRYKHPTNVIDISYSILPYLLDTNPRGVTRFELSSTIITYDTRTITLLIEFNITDLSGVDLLPYIKIYNKSGLQYTTSETSLLDFIAVTPVVESKTWSGEISVSPYVELNETDNMVEFEYIVGDISLNNTAKFDIETIMPSVDSVILDVSSLDYENNNGTLTIVFSKEIGETSDSLLSQITVIPSQLVDISNLQQTDVVTTWTANIIALPNKYHICAHIMVSYEGSTRRTNNFDIDTIIPELKRVDLDVDIINGFYYNKPTASIELEFSRELLEASITEYIEIEPSNQLLLTSLSKSVDDVKIWNGVISVSGEIQYTNASVVVNYRGKDNFSFLNLNVDTILPTFIDISMGTREINYNSISSNFTLEFSREILETDTQLLENHIITDPSDSLLVVNLEKDVVNMNKWVGTLQVNEEIDYSNGSIEVNYKDIIKRIENISIDTIIPDLSFVEISVSNFTYANSSAILTIGFTRNILETSEYLETNSITINANGKLQMTNLQKDSTYPSIWNAYLNVNGEQLEASCNITVNYKGKTLSTPSFEIQTFSTTIIKDIILDVSEFTYNTTSSQVQLTFSNEISETVDDLKNLIQIEPSNVLIMTNLSKDSINVSNWTATLTVSGEVEYDGGYIYLDYITSNKRVEFNIDTYVPDVSAVYLNIPNSYFTYYDTSAILTIEFTRNVIDDANYLLNNSITIEPQEYISLTNLQKNSENSLIWTGNIDVIGEVEYYGGKIIVEYKDTSGSTIEYNIDTIIPKVLSVTMDILEINYYTSTSNFTLEFSRNIIDTSINLQTQYIFINPNDKLIMEDLQQNSENPLIWNALISVSGEVEHENGSIEVSYFGTNKIQEGININTVIPELLNLTIDKEIFTYHDTYANITIEFTKTLVETIDILIANHINLYPEDALELVNLTQSYTNGKYLWTGEMQIIKEIEEPSGNIIVNYRSITKTTPLLQIDSIIPDVLSVTMDYPFFTYYDTSRNLTIEFSRNVLESVEDLQKYFIIIDPSETLIMTNLHQDSVNKLKWNAILTINGEVDNPDASIMVEYKGTNKTLDNINIDTVIPILYLLEMNPLELTYDEPSQDIKVYFTRNVLDSVEHFLTNYVSFEPSANLVLDSINKSTIDNKIWNIHLSVSGEIDTNVGEFKINYNGIIKTIHFAIDTIIPTIEYMTMTPNVFIIDKQNATNNITNDVSNASIEIKFARPINDDSINEFLTIRDKNLKAIPSTDISLSHFITIDEGTTWRGNMYILKYQLYYFNGSLLMDYITSYKSKTFDIDTVKTYTYSNKLVGPRNETVLAYYKPCYQIKRAKGQLYYVFDNNITNELCGIFGINEKNYENTTSNDKIPIGYNSNYELYNNSLITIASNGLIHSGLGSVTSESYNFRLTVGFITYTLSNVAYSDSLLSIIKDVLGIWSSMVNKPIESKFRNVNDYDNYSLTISFIISDFESSIQENMTSEIVTNYGTNFGSIFPKTSKIKIRKSYIESKVNSADNTITNLNHINSIKNLLKRSIGNALGIGHYWYLPTSPIDYDVMNHKYYSGINGVNKYKELFSSQTAFNGKLFGLPIEDYQDSNIFLEEGEQGSLSKSVTLNGFTHPGLDKEVMTKWIDSESEIPISIVSLGLLEDIGYDICYNNVDTYNPGAVFSNNYEIYIKYDLSINMFERLTDVYIQNKNNYHVKISSTITQGDLDNLLNTYIATVINNNVSNPINELIVTHNSDVDANWLSFNYFNGVDSVAVNILQNTNNETIASANDTRVYKFTTIKHDDGSITALLDKQINV